MTLFPVVFAFCAGRHLIVVEYPSGRRLRFLEILEDGVQCEIQGALSPVQNIRRFGHHPFLTIRIRINCGVVVDILIARGCIGSGAGAKLWNLVDEPPIYRLVILIECRNFHMPPGNG